MPVSVLVVDDHVVLAQALARRLEAEPDLVVGGVARNAEEAVRLARCRPFGLVLLDVCLTGTPGETVGLELGRRLRELQPDLVVVFLSFLDQPDLVLRGLQLGGRGWIAKDQPVAQLLATIRGALRGETWLDPRLLTDVLAAAFRPAAADDPLAALTPRERQVLQHLVDGLDRTDIATAMVLSGNTVRTHVQNLLVKLDVHSALSAVSVARQCGMQPSSATLRPAGRLVHQTYRHLGLVTDDSR